MSITYEPNDFKRVVIFLLGDSPVSEFYVPTLWNTLSLPPSYVVFTRVPKRRHIQIRSWEITQKKEYNTAQVSTEE